MSKNLSDIFPPTEIGGGGGGIEEAPKTGKLHGRKDGAWEEFDPGQLETGNQDGEILTWDTAAAKWVDDDRLMVSDSYVTYAAPSGDAGMIVQARSGNELISQTRYHSKNVAGTNVGGAIGHDGTNLCLSGATSLTAAKHVQIDATGNATFSGNVGIGGAPHARFNVISGSSNKGVEIDENSGAMRIMSFDRASGGPGNTDLTLRGRELKFQAAGGASAETRLTIDTAGNATFSGTVNANAHQGTDFYRGGRSGIRFGTGYLAPLGASNAPEDAAVSIGNSANNHRWKDAHFSGTVNAGTMVIRDRRIYDTTTCGAIWIDNSMQPVDSSGTRTTDAQDIGASGYRWKDAHFSGTVNATTINGRVTDVPDHVKAITPTDIANWNAGGGSGSAVTDGRITDTQIVHWDQAYSWGNHASAGYQPAGNYATAGTSYTKAESDAKYEPKGAGLPSGDWHCTGNITAEGNITAYSTSDERLKDDIAPMPLGLIDGINPVTFKWKDSGKSSGGVIAQQLQACGLGDWVNEAPNGDLGVDYNALVGVLLAEVLELKARVREMENANANP